jgi:hypothetical protein
MATMAWPNAVGQADGGLAVTPSENHATWAERLATLPIGPRTIPRFRDRAGCGFEAAGLQAGDIPNCYRWSASRATLILCAPTVNFSNFVHFRVGPGYELSANRRQNRRC